MRILSLINKFGKMAGWNNVTTSFLGRDAEGILEVSYNDTIERENVYGSGGFPIGRGDGNYSATASITLYVEEYRALMLSLGLGGRIQDIAPFDIAVSYDYDNGIIIKDRIRNCQFTNAGTEIKQGDKTIAYKFDLVVSHIEWNVA